MTSILKTLFVAVILAAGATTAFAAVLQRGKWDPASIPVGGACESRGALGQFYLD